MTMDPFTFYIEGAAAAASQALAIHEGRDPGDLRSALTDARMSAEKALELLPTEPNELLNEARSIAHALDRGDEDAGERLMALLKRTPHDFRAEVRQAVESEERSDG